MFASTTTSCSSLQTEYEMANHKSDADKTLNHDQTFEFSMHNDFGTFQNDIIIKKFGKIGMHKDLRVLYQLNPTYFDMLHTTYWNSVGNVLSCELSELHFYEYGTWDWQVKMLNSEGQFIKFITIEDWNPGIPHIFRKLIVNEITFQQSESKQDGLNIKELIAQVAPHITTLELKSSLPKELGTDGLKTFLDQFANLKQLTFKGFEGHGIDFLNPQRTMTISEFEIVYNIFQYNFKLKFTIYISAVFEEVLATFSTKPNMELVLTLMSPNVDADLRNYSNRFGKIKNVKYNILFGMQHDDYLVQLQNLTEVCVLNETQIEGLYLSVMFGHLEGQLKDEDQLSFKECLVKLSPFLTEFVYFGQVANSKVNVLSTEIHFPRLKNLQVWTYENSLEILKNCPQLEYLELRELDQTACFFQRNNFVNNLMGYFSTLQQQSDKENLADYFGKLTKLKRLSFASMYKGSKIKIDTGNEMDQYLREILPKLKCIHYNYYNSKSWTCTCPK